jgi:hypothetical protein
MGVSAYFGGPGVHWVCVDCSIGQEILHGVAVFAVLIIGRVARLTPLRLLDRRDRMAIRRIEE